MSRTYSSQIERIQGVPKNYIKLCAYFIFFANSTIITKSKRNQGMDFPDYSHCSYSEPNSDHKPQLVRQQGSCGSCLVLKISTSWSCCWAPHLGGEKNMYSFLSLIGSSLILILTILSSDRPGQVPGTLRHGQRHQPPGRPGCSSTPTLKTFLL